MGLDSQIPQQAHPEKIHWKLLDDQGTVGLSRQMDLVASGKQIDVFGHGWGVLFAKASTMQKVSAVVRGNIISLGNRNVACFFPPFSIVEWVLEPGSYQFEGIFFRVPLPTSFPKFPVAFTTTKEALPQHLDGISELVRSAADPLPIAKEDVISAAASRMKNLIEQTFMEEVSIALLAKQIGFNHFTTTRAFKRAYGMTPVRYRTKLRVYATIRDIVSGGQISAAAEKVGFQDPSQYNRQFKREMSHRPSACQPD